MDFLRELRLVFVFIGCTRLAGSDYPMDTKFLTLSLKDTVSSEKILSSVTPSTLFLSAERAKELLDYQRDETPLKVTMSCAEKGDSKTYTIDQMELYVE